MSKFEKLKKDELVWILDHVEAVVQDLPDVLEWTGYKAQVRAALVQYMPSEIQVIPTETYIIKITGPATDPDRLRRAIEEFLDQDYAEYANEEGYAKVEVA